VVANQLLERQIGNQINGKVRLRQCKCIWVVLKYYGYTVNRQCTCCDMH
jgi:hypothetical protein